MTSYHEWYPWRLFSFVPDLSPPCLLMYPVRRQLWHTYHKHGHLNVSFLYLRVKNYNIEITNHPFEILIHHFKCIHLLLLVSSDAFSFQKLNQSLSESIFYHIAGIPLQNISNLTIILVTVFLFLLILMRIYAVTIVNDTMNNSGQIIYFLVILLKI